MLPCHLLPKITRQDTFLNVLERKWKTDDASTIFGGSAAAVFSLFSTKVRRQQKGKFDFFVLFVVWWHPNRKSYQSSMYSSRQRNGGKKCIPKIAQKECTGVSKFAEASKGNGVFYVVHSVAVVVSNFIGSLVQQLLGWCICTIGGGGK